MTKILYQRKQGSVFFTLDVDHTYEELVKEDDLDKLITTLGRIHSLLLQDGSRWDEINGWIPPPFKTPESMKLLNKVSGIEPEIYRKQYAKT